MSQQTRAVLKSYFNTGDQPTESEFANLVDSMPNYTDDLTPVAFNDTDLDFNYDLIITTASSTFFEIDILQPDGYKMLTNGLVQKTSATEIAVHFGEPLAQVGDYYYLLKIY